MTKAVFLQRVNSPFLMGLFLFWKLPAAWFMGISVVSCDGKQSVIRLPYGWRSQNPFKSIYFAAQCAAGELSTGLLAMVALREQPPVSMLVLKVESEFYKKAAEPLLFTCTEGVQVTEAIQEAIESKKGVVLRMCSIGCLPDGSEAAKIWITWSFKARRQSDNSN